MTKAVVTFEGLNTASVLSHFWRQGVALYDVKRKGKICRIVISSTSVGEVVAYLREKCYNVFVGSVGSSAVVGFCKRRFVAVALAAMLVVAMCLASNLCLAVRVDGDLPEQVVVQALSQAGVKRFCSMDFSSDEVENKLCKTLGVAYAVVDKVGSVLYVTTVGVRSTALPIDTSKRRDIVSDVDGVVVRTVCTNGTLKVKAGDKVSVGDTLVEGIRDYGEGKTEPTYAMGRVTVMLTQSVTAEYDGTVTRTVPTEEVFGANYVRLFGRDYGKTCPFDSFDVTEKVTYLYPWHIAVVARKFVRTVSVTEVAPIDVVADELKLQAESLLRKSCQFEISSVEFVVRPDGVTATAVGYVEIE